MIGLLDVNVLIALFDPAHDHHEAAHGWFGEHRLQGWATCPITENGLIRILSNPRYPGRGTTPALALHHLHVFRQSGNHVFWPDSVSVCEPSLIETMHLRGHRQLTDAYLLALAARSGGRLVTFDRKIDIAVVGEARPEHLLRLDS